MASRRSAGTLNAETFYRCCEDAWYVEDIDSARAILLIGTNPAVEAPVLNARIRKAWTRGANVGLVGAAADLTYEYQHVGTGPGDLESLKDSGFDPETDGPSLVILGKNIE